MTLFYQLNSNILFYKTENQSMKRVLLIFVFLNILILSFPIDVYINYVQAYGEGPTGKYLIGSGSKDYSEEDAVEYARSEIIEFLSGMIYGYNFKYKVDNRITGRKGYFELESITKIKIKDKNIKLTQVEEKKDALRLQATYRLSEDQKTYIRGFHSSLAKMSIGEAVGSWVDDWPKRLDVYKDALQNAVLNEARLRLKSRPMLLEGKIQLIESPFFGVVSGQWKVRVRTNIRISNIVYEDVY